MHQLSYPKAQFSMAIKELTIGQGNIRTRLAQVYKIYLSKLHRDDFPDDLKEDWDWIQYEMTKYGPVTSGENCILGSVDNTMRKIKGSTGEKIAKRIVDFHSKLVKLSENTNPDL